MQITSYDGYFDNGSFYISGRAVQIPEKRRVIVTVLDDAPNLGERANLRFDFVNEVPPLPDSFFDPLPQEEIKLWEL